MTQEIQRIAVCVSGGGRSLRNLLERQDEASWKIAAVVSSAADCGANQIARNAGLPLFIGDFRKAVLEETTKSLALFLNQQRIDWIVLAGFLKLFPALPEYAGQVINIHPALLPKFGGKGMHGQHVHEAVLKAGEARSGATVHFVNEHYDEGAIISQIEVPVHRDDTSFELAARVFAAECQLLPWTIEQLTTHQLPLRSGVARVLWEPA